MIYSRKKIQNRKGIALLVTLLVLVLITSFMTEFFFETSLEIRAIQNFKSSFTAQSVAKSMFKATLEGLILSEIETLDLLGQFYNLTGDRTFSILNPPTQLIKIPNNFLEDFEGATVYTPYIRPIDHLYNLNRITGKTGTMNPESDLNAKNLNEFVNIVSKISIEIPQEEGQSSDEPPETMNLEISDITQLYANLFDYMDRKDNNAPYSAGAVIGSENSIFLEVGESIEIPPKNRLLDRFTEIRLVQGFMDSGISIAEWKKHFTIYPVGTGDEPLPRLNINLAEKDEIIEYLERFKLSNFNNNTGMNLPEEEDPIVEYAENAGEIAEKIAEYSIDKDGKRVEFSNLNNIGGDLANDLGLVTNQPGQFFTLHSQWFEIRMVAEVNGIQAEVQAVVYIPKNENGNSNGSPEIKEFLIK